MSGDARENITRRVKDFLLFEKEKEAGPDSAAHDRIRPGNFKFRTKFTYSERKSRIQSEILKFKVKFSSSKRNSHIQPEIFRFKTKSRFCNKNSIVFDY